jgi:hypothetical protein
MTRLERGSHLGPYQIEELIGHGGMGAVYRARDDRLHRDVAIKVLLPSQAATDASGRRFHQEALALARLSHPNIASLYDIGRHGDLDYFVMECVPGQSLASRIVRGPLPVPDVLRLGIQVADAIGEATEHGIVHRDLKPANIIITPKGHAKVLDFGIAKLLMPIGTGTPSQTTTQGAIGTPHYMSPEQAFGEAVDVRADLWSLGVVLYEALTGAMPFQGPTSWAVFQAISTREPASSRTLRAEIPPAVDRILARALAKRVADRYQTPEEMSRDLRTALDEIIAPPAAVQRSRAAIWPLLAAFALVIAVVGAAGWYFVRVRHQNWARGTALPETAKLITANQPLAAFRLLQRAEGYLPSDSTVLLAVQTRSRVVTVTSTPAGATIELQDYVAPKSDWYPLGTTPIEHARIPAGYFRWRVTRPGHPPYIAAPITSKVVHFALDSMDHAPAGMVLVPSNTFENFIAFVGWIGPYHLPAYYIDKFEITNAQYQKFVDAGGYQHREFWRQPFRSGDTPLTWDEAMARLRDQSGRPGPATWQGGHYPAGQANFPVGGVSWYEAAAYAAYANLSLPTLAQWYTAAPPGAGPYSTPVSNIGRTAVAPVGSFPNVGPDGTYDMAGNVREWVENAFSDDQRVLLGGAWSSEPYIFSEPEAFSPFDRSPENGFRCVSNLGPVPAAAAAPLMPYSRNFATFRPASDAVFRAYGLLYAYDTTLALNAKLGGTVGETPDWIEQRITVDAAYGRQRLPIYLFLPKRVHPPYQVVTFFPSARVLDMTDSRSLGDTAFFNYVIESGRALAYPIYQNTYERRIRDARPRAGEPVPIATQRYQDLARTIDYLATRSDIDTAREAYLGVSMGSAEGVIDATLLQRHLKTAVFLDGGYFLDKPTAGHDQADFAPRLKLPVLMVNGRYDFAFPVEEAQLPLFRMLGAPASDKAHLTLDTPHDVAARPAELVPAVLGWLDKYLGRVH